MFSQSYILQMVPRMQLDLFPDLQCSYNYDLQVHTHGGERSTKELNFNLNSNCSN